MRKFIIPLLSGLVLGSSAAAATNGQPAAGGGLDKIAAYAGTWKTGTEHFATPFSKAGKESATLRNDCWRSAGYYACDQLVNGDSKALIVFTYDAKDDTYATYPIIAGSGNVQSGKLIIKGNVWTFPWKVTEKGKTSYFRVLNIFMTPDTIEFRQEYSQDQVHWFQMAQGFEQKIDK
ncbi:MAG: hypothetical protein KGJ56_07910 [Gammaproteobacteria bacterium]|nr:hypothetical protein [Gammaproteobacteria bacterium]